MCPRGHISATLGCASKCSKFENVEAGRNVTSETKRRLLFTAQGSGFGAAVLAELVFILLFYKRLNYQGAASDHTCTKLF